MSAWKRLLTYHSATEDLRERVEDCRLRDFGLDPCPCCYTVRVCYFVFINFDNMNSGWLTVFGVLKDGQESQVLSQLNYFFLVLQLSNLIGSQTPEEFLLLCYCLLVAWIQFMWHSANFQFEWKSKLIYDCTPLLWGINYVLDILEIKLLSLQLL